MPATKNHAAVKTRSRMKVGEVRAGYGMTRADFHRLIGISERRLADLENGKASPTESVRRRFTEADRLRRELATVIEKGVIRTWMQEPNPAFEGLKPLEVLERGQADRLWRMIYELKSGHPG
ncbi:MAG: antitoxin Xre/MbcA/ParS toxin-binding domain-containing protein [Planctomycetota bacterium]